MISSHLIVALLAAAISATGAWKVQTWRFDSIEAARIDQEAEVKRMNSHGAQLASSGHEADREKIRTEFVTITETVEKIVKEPIYLNVCFDDDGMRALSAAVSGNRPAASKLGPAVP